MTANPSNGGTVSGGGSFTHGQNCTVSATANNGYTFTNWTENGSVVSTNASYSFTVEANRSLVANFTANTYTVGVTANPSNGGTVSGGGSFNHGQSCTVSATANTGYTFINWTENGAQVSSQAEYTFSVNGNRNLVAHFISTVGVKEDMTSASIYPNPFASVVRITTERTVQNISVYDVFGRLLMQQPVSGMQFEIDLSELSPGTYLLQVDYGDSRSMHRIQKTN